LEFGVIFIPATVEILYHTTVSRWHDLLWKICYYEWWQFAVRTRRGDLSHIPWDCCFILHEQFPERVISLQRRPGNSDNGYGFPCINRRCFSEYGSNKLLFQFSLKFVSIIEFSKLVLNLSPLLQYYQMEALWVFKRACVTNPRLKIITCSPNVLIAFYNRTMYSCALVSNV